jgi:hypothetical protein
MLQLNKESLVIAFSCTPDLFVGPMLEIASTGPLESGVNMRISGEYPVIMM